MRCLQEQIEELQAIFGTEVRQLEEAGYLYIYIPGLKMPPGCTPERTDALFCPYNHGAYTSRLFFKELIQTPKPVNWNGQVFVLGQQWHAFSYNNVQNMPLIDMITNHLRGMVA